MSSCLLTKPNVTLSIYYNYTDIILRPKDFFLNVERYSFVSTYDSFIRPTCKGHEERLKDCQVEYTQSQSTSYNYYGDDSCDYDGIICIPADKSILPGEMFSAMRHSQLRR